MDLQPQDTQHAQISRQFALVSHLRKRSIRTRICRRASTAHAARDGITSSFHHLIEAPTSSAPISVFELKSRLSHEHPIVHVARVDVWLVSMDVVRQEKQNEPSQRRSIKENGNDKCKSHAARLRHHLGRRNTNPRSLACAPALRQSAESQRQLRGTLLVQESSEQV